MGNLTPGNGTASPYLTGSQVYALAVNAGFSQTPQYTVNGQKYSAAEIATAISKAESGWNANNQGDQSLAAYGSNGLWQIFSGAWSPSSVGLSGSWSPSNVAAIDVPLTNAQAAYTVFSDQGFSAWSTYNSGAYKQWLPDAAVAAEGPNAALPAGGGSTVAASTTAAATPAATSASATSFLSGAGSLLLSPFQSLFTDLGQGLERIAIGLVGLVLVFMALHQAGK